MDIATTIQILCFMFSSPEYHLSKQRQDLACKSIEHVIKESKKHNISYTLLLSVIYIESGWKKNAVSPANACGLTQVIPKYTGNRITGTRKLTCQQLKNPRVAITAGAKTLSYWVNKYANRNIPVALCGYAAGYRCKGKRVSKGGMRYARKVLRFQKRIEAHAKKIIE